MSVRVSCPYCNAAFDLPAPPASRRTPCPRCGEAVPVKPSADPFPAASSNGEPTAPPPDAPAPALARALLPLAGIGLVLGLVVLAAGLTALFLGDPPAPPTVAAPPKPPSTWPPAAVPGLAYLPADVNIVAAVQPRSLAQYAERAKADPAGLPDAVRSALDRIGLPPERIDHVAAGVQLTDDNPLPRVVLALTVVPPVDEAALLRSWKAAPDPDKPGRHRVDLAGLPLELAKAGDAVYVFATRGSDLDGLAGKVGRGSGHLPADVREAMARLSPASAAWAATGVARWADKAAVRFGSQAFKQPEWPKRLAGVTQAAAGVSLEPGPKLTATVRGDPAAVPDLQKRLADALGDGAAVNAEGEWVTGVRAVEVKAAAAEGK